MRRNPLAYLATGLSLRGETDILQAIAGLRTGEVLLDLACGTGAHTRHFARRLSAGLTVALDTSLAMLEQAASYARSEGAENVLWVRADATALPVRSSVVNVANCFGALHLFRDPSRALSEASRVLTPGGCLLVGTFRRKNTRISRIRDALGRRYLRGLIGFHAFTSAELDALFTEAGLVEFRCHHARGEYMIASGLKPRLEAADSVGPTSRSG